MTAATARRPLQEKDSFLIERFPSAYPAKTPRRDAGSDARITTGRNPAGGDARTVHRPRESLQQPLTRSRTRPSIAPIENMGTHRQAEGSASHLAVSASPLMTRPPHRARYANGPRRPRTRARVRGRRQQHQPLQPPIRLEIGVACPRGRTTNAFVFRDRCPPLEA